MRSNPFSRSSNVSWYYELPRLIELDICVPIFKSPRYLLVLFLSTYPLELFPFLPENACLNRPYKFLAYLNRNNYNDQKGVTARLQTRLILVLGLSFKCPFRSKSQYKPLLEALFSSSFHTVFPVQLNRFREF